MLYSKPTRDAQDVNTNSDLALALAQRGIEIFLCREMSSGRINPKTGKPKFTAKSPYTPNGFEDASCDIGQVRRWWNKYPAALIGVVPGQEAVNALVLGP